MYSFTDASGMSHVIQMVIEGWGAFFYLIAIIVIWQTRWSDKNKADGLIRFIAADFVLLIMDVFAQYFRGQAGIIAYHIVRISNLMVFVMGYLVIIFGVSYFGELIESRVGVSIRTWKFTEYAIGIIGVTMVMINTIYPFLYAFDDENRYYRLPGSWMISFSYILGVLLIMALILNFFGKMSHLERIAVFSALILPMISLVLQVNRYGTSLTIIATTITVTLTFVSHMMDYTAMVAKREREREKWIADENIRLLHNQIKPHFIYNALTGIYYGLDEDIAGSRKALKSLSGYLRGSLDVLAERKCVDFNKELMTVKNYLDVEAFRFDGAIHFEVDAQDTDFEIPAFCLQTLVENAVHHGIRKKDPPEGSITIRTRFQDRTHRIEIIDDGIGFDIDKALEKEGVHIGLKNTIRRLRLMCGGTMQIESTPNAGSKIIVTIPADVLKHE